MELYKHIFFIFLDYIYFPGKNSKFFYISW